MPLSDQLLGYGVLIVAGALAIVLFFRSRRARHRRASLNMRLIAERFAALPQQATPPVTQVAPLVEEPEAPGAPRFPRATSAPVVDPEPLQGSPGFGVLMFGVVLLVITGILGYSLETRRNRRQAF